MNDSPVNSAPVIRFSGVRFHRGSWSLGPLDFVIAPGERVALIGPTGSGKSTVLDLLAGLERPAAGEIAIGGDVVSTATRMTPPHRRGLAYVLQGMGLWDERSARKNLEIVLTAHGDARPADSFLDRVAFRADRDRPVGELSGGERKKVAIARGLAARAGIRLFDEPGAHLDRASRDEVFHGVSAAIQADGATLIVAVHAAADAVGLGVTRTLSLVDGRIELA